MIEKNRKNLKILNILSDAVLIVLSYLIAMYTRYTVFNGSITVNPFQGRFLLIIAIMSVLLAVLFEVNKSNYLNVIPLTAIGTLVIMAVFFINREMDFSRWSLVIFFVLSSALIIIKHAIGHKIISSNAILGYGKRVIALAGSGKAADQYRKDVEKNFPQYEIVPFDFNSDVDEIVIALEPSETDKTQSIIDFADKEGIYISLIPFFNEYIPAHPEIESIGNSKLINLRATPLDNFGNASIKRMMDVMGSLLMIILLSPLMIFAAIGVKITSPGPVFFKQERVGKDKKPFYMLKFRSMRVNSEESTAWSTSVDSRRTKFGSFIRKYSIDELPQLFNVLLGDMSLIGPRPEIPFYVAQFKETVPLYLVRQQVRPGMTGWAQIHGLRGDTSIEDRVVYDIWYIENWSLGLDLRILLATVFKGKFVNEEVL